MTRAQLFCFMHSELLQVLSTGTHLEIKPLEVALEFFHSKHEALVNKLGGASLCMEYFKGGGASDLHSSVCKASIKKSHRLPISLHLPALFFFSKSTFTFYHKRSSRCKAKHPKRGSAAEH